MLAIRSGLFTLVQDPFLQGEKASYRYIQDGLLIVDNNKIIDLGDASTLMQKYSHLPLKTYSDSVIVPGFIDSHVHYAQTEIMASFGKQLIDWLNNYTFVAEQKFADIDHATTIAELFISEQLKQGVTTSAVYATVFPQSVDALFMAAEKYNMRLMVGKVCMDQHAPQALLDTPQKAYDESVQLIEKWHRKGRYEYIITPRFAPTSSVAQLEILATLAKDYPDMLIQSHISENVGEIEWVKALFPQHKDYTEVYEHYGLLRSRAIYGHGIHLSNDELSRFHETGASISHCPTSNFFLGSGAFNVQHTKNSQRPVLVGLGTDVGAGTTFSMLGTMQAAYFAAQQNGYPLSAIHAFYLATLGSAEALGIADKVGSLTIGKEADFVVLNLYSTPVIRRRMHNVNDIEEALFVQMMLGDDRAIAATYIAGHEVYTASL